jgi:hypothetical protein
VFYIFFKQNGRCFICAIGEKAEKYEGPSSSGIMLTKTREKRNRQKKKGKEKHSATCKF